MAALAALAFAGCGSSASSPSKPVRGGTLQIAQPADPTTLDQFRMSENEGIRIVSQITEPLYRTDATGRLVPWLATGHRESDDGRTVTFTLRDGVRFSNGQPLTAADVVFTLQQSRASASWGFLMSNIASVRAAGPSRVVVKLNERSASLLADLALFANGIVPADFAGASAQAFGRHPIGTGPFMLGRWAKGQYVQLERNPAYWQSGRPLLDELKFNGVPDENARIAQLRGGQQDLIANPPWPQLETLAKAPNLKVGRYALARLDALILNAKQAPFDDVAVRRAVSEAIDRSGLVKVGLAGNGAPATSMLPPSVPYYDKALPPIPFDTAASRATLADVADQGKRIELMFFTGEPQASMAQVIQQNLKEAGLDVVLAPTEQSTALEKITSGDFDMMLTYSTSDIDDPAELSFVYVTSNGLYSGVSTRAEAVVVQKADQAPTDAERAREYARLQLMAREANGYIPLVAEPWVWAMSTKVDGFQVNPTGIPWLADVGLTR